MPRFTRNVGWVNKSRPSSPPYMFGELEKGDFFKHSGRVYVKTNPSTVENRFYGQACYSSQEKTLRCSERHITFNAVRVVDHLDKVGSRGQFQDNTTVVPLSEVNVSFVEVPRRDVK